MTALTLFRVGLAALLWLALASPLHAQKRVALVVGNAAYSNAPYLRNPPNDADAIAKLLETAGFEVMKRTNLGNVDFKRALREFTMTVRDADIALVYFAGHGIEAKGTNYLLPIDAKLDSDYDADDEAVLLARVIEAVEPAKRLRVIILDACRDNPFDKRMQRVFASRAVNRGLTKIEPTNVLVGYAARAGATALDGVGKNSPYTTALLKHLATPGVEVRKIFGLVRDEVLNSTRQQQEPFVYGSIGGEDFFLVPPSIKSPQVAAGGHDVRRDYELAMQIGQKEVWNSFLVTHPSGLHADMARAQLRKLEQEATAAKAAADKAAADKAATAKAAADKAAADKATAAKAAADKAAADKAAADKAAADKAAADKAAADKATTDKSAADEKAGRMRLVAVEPKGALVTPPARGLVCAQRVAQHGPVGGPITPVSLRVSLEGAREIRAAAFSSQRNEIATAGDDGLIRVWSAASFKLLRVLRGHSGPVYSVDYSPDGSVLASASWDGTVSLWNAGSDRPTQTFEAVAVAVEGGGARVKQWSVAFTPETPLRYVAAGGDDGHVRIWDLRANTLVRARLDHRSEPDKLAVRSLSFHPSGSGEFVTGGFDGKIRFYFTERSRVDTKDAYARKTLRVAYSPDGTRLVSAGSEAGRPDQKQGYLKLWTLKGQTSRPLVGHGDYVVSAAWSPDGKRIVSGGGGRDKTVRLWDAQSGRQLATFSGHTADIEAVVYDAQRSRIISVSEDRMIKVWDIASQNEIVTVIGFGASDYVSYAPNGCYTGSDQIETRLGIFNGKSVSPLTNDARAILFAPEGVQ